MMFSPCLFGFLLFCPGSVLGALASLLLLLAHLLLKSPVDDVGLEIGIAFGRIGRDDNDLFHHIMTAKTLAPELDMNLASAARRYSTLGKSGIGAPAGRPGLLYAEVLISDVGKPEVIDDSIALIYLPEIHRIDVKFDNAHRIGLIGPCITADKGEEYKNPAFIEHSYEINQNFLILPP